MARNLSFRLHLEKLQVSDCHYTILSERLPLGIRHKFRRKTRFLTLLQLANRLWAHQRTDQSRFTVLTKYERFSVPQILVARWQSAQLTRRPIYCEYGTCLCRKLGPMGNGCTFLTYVSMYNTLIVFSANQFTIPKFDTLIMSFEVILCSQPILISLATAPQDVMQISEIQQSKTLFRQGVYSFCERSFCFYSGLTTD